MLARPPPESPLTPSSSARRHTRFTFFAGRPKPVAARTPSVRRTPSHRRTPSLTVAASRRHSRRLSVLHASAAVQRIASETLINLDRPTTPPRPTLAIRSQTLPTTMAKDAELPPLPSEASDHPPPDAPPPSGKGIFKRLTTRIRSPSASASALPSPPTASTSRAPLVAPAAATTATSADPSKRRKSGLKLPSLPALPKPQAPPLPVNAFTSPELRQAALRERGLLPTVPKPYRDQHGYMIPLSEQEAEIDRRRSVLAQEPGRTSADDDIESEAKKIREAWLRKNSQDQPSSADQGPTPLSGTLQQQPQQHQQQEQPQLLHRGQGSISASERASALAATDDSIVIGTQQSPRRGTFVHSPHHTTAAVVLVNVNMDVSDLATAGPSMPSSQMPAVPLTGSTTSTVEPHKVPLPASPTSMRTPLTPTVGSEEGQIVVLAEQTAATSEHAAPHSSSLSPAQPSPAPLRSPASTKSRPSPITVVALSASQSAPHTAIPLVLDASPPLDFADPRSPRSVTLPTLSVSPPPTPHATTTTTTTSTPPPSSPRTPTPTATRGRSMTVVTNNLGAISLAPSTSTGSSSSRIPALSPTRTTSSSMTTSSVPPTPTGTGIASLAARRRKSSVVSEEEQEEQEREERDGAGSPVRRRGRTAEGRLRVRIEEEGLGFGLGLGVEGGRKEDAEGGLVGPGSCEVVVESPVEVDADGEASAYGTAELGERGDVPGAPTPRARLGVQRARTETQERRKSISFGLFGKSAAASSSETSSPRLAQPKPIRSMSNLRRSVAGTLSSKLRPKSTLVVSTSGKVDVSRLPPSPAPSPMPGSRSQTASASASSVDRRDGGLGLRQPLSPTVHSRGSILLSTGKIEDDESRRLSEMAFLDF